LVREGGVKTSAEETDVVLFFIWALTRIGGGGEGALALLFDVLPVSTDWDLFDVTASFFEASAADVELAQC
jgi:hypothetical protein